MVVHHSVANKYSTESANQLNTLLWSYDHIAKMYIIHIQYTPTDFMHIAKY